jgi:hypothetical protein
MNDWVSKYILATEPRLAMGPTQPSINEYRAFSPKTKRPERSADHLPPSNAKTGRHGATPPLHHTSSRCDETNSPVSFVSDISEYHDILEHYR